MIVHAKWSAVKQSHWYEYLMRFVFGGLATVMAGVVAQFFGPDAGGLFLAFPAIFIAGATLIEKHERERKQRLGLSGERRGKDAAALDATGAGRGSIGLAAFGAAIWYLAPDLGYGSLAAGSVAWLLVSLLLWRARRLVAFPKPGNRHRPATRR